MMNLEVSSLQRMGIAEIRVAMGRFSKFARPVCPTPRRLPSDQSASRRPAPLGLRKCLTEYTVAMVLGFPEFGSSSVGTTYVMTSC
jgi:hypothetical protein